MGNEIKTVGIIGSGKMGTNLFYYLLDFGFGLTWVCSKDADPEKLKRSFSRKLNRSLDAGVMDEASYSVKQRDTVITGDIRQIQGCDLIIEAVSENLEVKKKLFMDLDKIADDGCILTSNSSSFKPSELTLPGIRRENTAGLHFFYPVALKNIVEIIVSGSTSEDTTRKIVHFLGSIDRDYLLLKEDHGFILNKIFLDFQNEAFLIVNEGTVTIPQMDAMIKKHLFPVGVFDFCDSVGIDVMLASVRNYIKDYPSRAGYLPFVDVLERLVNAGKYGIKSGEGFYNYSVEDVPGDTMLEDLQQEFVETAIGRLRKKMAASIRKFSELSGLNLDKTNAAMKEYTGCENDLLTL